MTPPTAAMPAHKTPSWWPAFLTKGRISGFLAVVMSGQIVYSSFEAFKGSLLLPLTEVLGLSKAEFGILMGWVGIAMFLYVPCAWVNNRFKVRTILFWSLAWRLITALILFVFLPPFSIMVIIAASWGVLDAIMWPAVVNGVSITAEQADKEGKGLAMGLLESIRRFAEVAMNLVIVGLMVAFKDQAGTVMWIACIAYTLLIIPMMFWVWKSVPDNEIAHEEGKSDHLAALLGVLKVLVLPRVWLAGLAAMFVYWTYVNLIFCSAPFLAEVFNVSQGVASMFGVFNTGFVGIVAGIVSGTLADYVFKSSTKMMAIALGLAAVSSVIVVLMPRSEGALWPTVILLILVAFATFLSKSVILAPVAELKLPEGISGSAMSVGSFLAYASVFWGYYTTGAILDSFKSDPAHGYEIVFLITCAVAVAGCICAGLLVVINAGSRRSGRL